MQVIFLPSHEHCGCYGNGNGQNVAKIYGFRDNSKTIQTSSMKLGAMCFYMHVILFSPSYENCGCYVNGN